MAARPRRSAVRLEVWDTGAGFAAADLQRIFDEFVHVGNAERDRPYDLGLGLSIARRSGALIGATIGVSSRPRRGSRFGFELPAASPGLLPALGGSSGRPEGVYDALPRAHDRNLLIVDDDASVRIALGDLLTRWLVPFDAAADADAALRLVNSGDRYGLVSANYRLPGGSTDLNSLRR